MGKIIWNGIEQNHLTVGKTKLAKYQTVQSALDAIEAAGDNAADNRYIITVGPGLWKNADAKTGHHLSYVSIAGEDKESCILMVDDVTYEGGVLVIADTAIASGNTVEVLEVSVSGLHIINGLAGGGASGGAPEGALYVGAESIHPDTRHWNNITISDCIIDGEHDALQLFGISADVDTGYCLVQNCLVRSQHDAVTVKGSMKIDLLASSIRAVTTNNAVYGLDSNVTWKTTGIHCRTDLGNSNYDTQRINIVGCSVYVYCDQLVGTSATTGHLAGYLCYVDLLQYPTRIIGSEFTVIDNYNSARYRVPACIVCSAALDTEKNKVVVNGCSLRTEQWNTGSSAPNVAGVSLATPLGVYSPELPNSPLTILNTNIDGRSDKPGGQAYRFYTYNTQSYQTSIRYKNVVSSLPDYTYNPAQDAPTQIDEPLALDGDVLTLNGAIAESNAY